MSTLIRPEVSKKNKYWISKHRYYELKHFCLQYNEFKSMRAALLSKAESVGIRGVIGDKTGVAFKDPTGDISVCLALVSHHIELIEKCARNADNELSDYILEAVTKELSYDALRAREGIPCGKDMFYDRYRRFFYILSGLRG